MQIVEEDTLPSIPDLSGFSREVLAAAIALAAGSHLLPSHSQTGSAESSSPSQVNQTPDGLLSEEASANDGGACVSTLDEETLKLLGDDPGKEESESSSCNQTWLCDGKVGCPPTSKKICLMGC